jgi:hypothetical protein
MHLSCYNIPHDTPLELDTGKRQVVLVYGMSAYWVGGGGSGGIFQYIFIIYTPWVGWGPRNLDVVDRKIICVPVSNRIQIPLPSNL